MVIITILRLIWASMSVSWHSGRRIAYYLSMRYNWFSENAVVTDSSPDFSTSPPAPYISNLDTLPFLVLLLNHTGLSILFWHCGYDSLWRREDILKKGEMSLFERCSMDLLKCQSFRIVLQNKECKCIYLFDSNHVFHQHLIYYMYLHSKVSCKNDE